MCTVVKGWGEGYARTRVCARHLKPGARAIAGRVRVQNRVRVRVRTRV